MSKTPLTDIMVTGNSDPGADEYDELLVFTRQLEIRLATVTDNLNTLIAYKARLEDASGRLLIEWSERIKDMDSRFSCTDYDGGLLDAYNNCIRELDTAIEAAKGGQGE